MPAKNKKSKAAKLKRQPGEEKFLVSAVSEDKGTQSDTDWIPSEDEGHTKEVDELDAYSIMQVRFARHFKKKIGQKDLIEEPTVCVLNFTC